MRCESCGLEAPTKNVQLYQNIGMLVMRRYESVKGHLCRSCIESYFWRYTLVNATLGWWGLISLFMTPLFIANNLFQFIGARGLGSASIGPGISPAYVASPSTQVQCPYCQSYQTRAARLSGTIFAGLAVGVLFLIWGVSLDLRFMLGQTSTGNMVIGVVLIGIAVLAALCVWMIVSHRAWECQQCARSWVPRRS